MESPNLVPTNFPLQLTSFIGRERGMTEVKRLLSATRLVTLTGAGGCGKTRLALQVASDLLDTFPDGVWLVEFAALSDPALVPQAIAAAVGVREIPAHSLGDSLLQSLRARNLLLVLDNCEHLLEACARLAEQLLRACAQLRILATSREPLGVWGETVWRVPSLDVPNIGSALPSNADLVSVLTQSEAARLFVDRALAVLPTFLLTNRNAPAVAEVCQRLDGIPLAIELAAARVKTLSVEEIAARLNDCFALLTGGRRTALPRQQTLRASMEWSHALLTLPEQVLFRRLSVFVGGWTLEAAEQVTGDTPVTRHSTLDTLSQLVNKSLVIAEEQNGQSRYRMLETIQQYARAKLTEAGETQTMQKRHLEFYVRLTEQAEPKLQSAEQKIWLDRLAVESDNWRAALRWASQSGEVELGLRLGGALWRYWDMCGNLSEGRGWLEGLLALAADAARADLLSARAKALHGLGVMAHDQGDYEQARSLYEQALTLRQELGDRLGVAALLSNMGLVAQEQSDYKRAISFYEECLKIRQELGDKWGTAVSLNNLGLVAQHRGDYEQAESLYQQSLALAREVGDKRSISVPLANLGEVAQCLGEYQSAASFYQESLTLKRDVGDKWGTAVVLSNLGKVAQRQGNHQRATALLEDGLRLFRELGDKWGIAISLNHLAETDLGQGDLGQAIARYVQSLRSYQELSDKEGIAFCLEGLAGVAVAQNEPERAARLLGAAHTLRQTIGAPLPPDDRAVYDRHVTALRAKLGKGKFAASFASGGALSAEQAIAEALTVEERTLRDETTPALPATRPAPIEALRIYALGATRVYRGERELTSSDWKYLKARELFFYLLCHPPRTKEQIGIALWPDASPAQLRSNFRVILYYLRRALGSPEWVLFEEEQYAFNRALAPHYWFDSEAFAADLEAAQRLGAKEPAQAIQHLERAVQLYQGEFLADWAKGEWHLPRREELQQAFTAGLLRLGQLLFANNRYADSAEIYRKAIAQDSYLETAHRELIRCYARQGDRGKALRQYQTLVKLMREELGASPAQETQVVYQRLQRDEEV